MRHLGRWGLCLSDIFQWLILVWNIGQQKLCHGLLPIPESVSGVACVGPPAFAGDTCLMRGTTFWTGFQRGEWEQRVRELLLTERLPGAVENNLPLKLLGQA